MSIDKCIIRILVEGEPEYSFLQQRIINKFSFCFPDIDFRIIRMGSKSNLLSIEVLSQNFLMLRDPNVSCIFLCPDFHPTSTLNLNHSDLNSLRESIYDEIERVHPTHNIQNYRERFLIHIFKNSGDVVFLTCPDLIFEEFNISDENFKSDIMQEIDLDNLEELPQVPEEISIEKSILKKILKKVKKRYSIKNLSPIIPDLRIEDLVNKLPHLKEFLIDIFKFADQNQIPPKIKAFLGID